MSTRRFRAGHDPQPYLLPPAVTDWRPADHPAYAGRALVDQLDLAPGYAAYGPMGQPPYDPRVMVRIWVYAYARGVRSSRQVERACGDDRGFRVVAGNQQPDFWTLAAFRRRHAAALGNLLQESVRLDAAAAAEPAARHAVKVQAAADAGRPAPPAPATPAVPAPQAQTNFTDPDSRIMRNSEKAFIQGYNAQVAVDADTQIIVGAQVTNPAADAPHRVGRAAQVTPRVGRAPAGVLVDAGYWSEGTLAALADQHIPAAIPPEKIRHRAWRATTPPRGRIPKDLSRKDRRRRYLRTKAGRQRYRRRQISVEPVIGYLKTVQGYRQTLRRGRAGGHHDGRFACAVANLAKILRVGARPGSGPAAGAGRRPARLSGRRAPPTRFGPHCRSDRTMALPTRSARSVLI
jgi:transposase